jgi:tRNA pseudouridine13 synthase
MYQIKESPENFMVREVSNVETKSSGRYAICLLKKTNYTTIRALEHIAGSLSKNIKELGFAGTKDKNAVTEQYISIKNTNKQKIESLNLKDIEIRFLGYSDEPISLGRLEGNEFIITIKDIDEKDIKNVQKKPKLMPNFFGEQRFSKNNIEIGKNLLKSDFKKATKLILDSNSDYKEKISGFLEKNTNNFTAALQLIPKRLLRLYLHSYQSYLWNKTLQEYMKINKENITIPIIGFGTEVEDKKLNMIIEKVMKEENITYRDFINKHLHELSSEGSNREAFTEIKDFKIIEKNKDSIKINFKLRKGSYATEAIKYLFS